MNQAAQTMPLAQALALRSLEGFLYCIRCGGLDEPTCAADNFCNEGAEHTYIGHGTVADMAAIKRQDEEYAELLGKLRSEGQQEPIAICPAGTCLQEGHHRLAALAELGVEEVTWSTYRAHCTHQTYVPAHLTGRC